MTEADRLGELRTVNGANWEQDIGLACTLMKYSDDNPALLFDEIPGHKKGFRVLAGIFGGKRKNMTLGFPVDLDKVATRELNSRLHAPAAATNERSWKVLNPNGKHALAVGLSQPLEVLIDGHAGYYCGGMNQQAAITINGHCES